MEVGVWAITSLVPTESSPRRSYEAAKHLWGTTDVESVTVTLIKVGTNIPWWKQSTLVECLRDELAPRGIEQNRGPRRIRPFWRRLVYQKW